MKCLKCGIDTAAYPHHACPASITVRSDGWKMAPGISIGLPVERKPWTDEELDRLADLLVRREARRLLDAQDAEAKRDKRKKCPNCGAVGVHGCLGPA